VRVDGRIDTVTASELDDVIGSLFGRRAYRVVIDLAGAHYVSSAGWGVFVSRLREARAGGGDIRLGRMQTCVHDVYDLLEFDGLLSSDARLEESIAAFTGEPAGESPVELLDESPGESAEQHPVAGDATPARRTAPPQAVAQPSHSDTLKGAVLRLVVEDPFYTINEMRVHLRRARGRAPGWWEVWQILQQQKLLRRRRRFSYFRRYRDVGPQSW
jgi:anti-sigma B factor antagonist